MANWYIGQEEVYVGPSIRGYEKDKVYKIINIHKCKQLAFYVGLPCWQEESTQCSICKKKIMDGSYVYEKYFRPLEKRKVKHKFKVTAKLPSPVIETADVPQIVEV